MLGSTLLLASILCTTTETNPAPFTGGLAKLPVIPMHCLDANLQGTTEDDFKPLVTPSISKNGVPPSPPIFSRRGWLDACSVVSVRRGFTPHQTVDQSPDPTDILPVTPEVADILDRWEAASCPMTPVHIRFSQITYDHARHVELWGEGQLRYESSSRGRVQIDPSTVSSSDVSQLKAPSGKPYRVKGVPEWGGLWREHELWVINSEGRTIYPLPSTQKPMLFLYVLQQHAPLVFESCGDMIRRQWSFNLTGEDPQSFFLEALPRTTNLKHRFRKCLIRVDKKSSKTTAVKYFSAFGEEETVYTIHDSTPISESELRDIRWREENGCVFILRK